MKSYNPLFFASGPEMGVLKDLPRGVQELTYAKPRRAVGSGLRDYTWCDSCGGWICGKPLIQTENDSEAFRDGRIGRVSRCRRCGEELSFTGTYHKEAKHAESKKRQPIKQSEFKVQRGIGGVGN